MIRNIDREDYIFETAPYDHQRDIFLTSRSQENWAYLMEMGTGKTKVAIDNAAFLFEQGLIKFLLIAAPNEVHRNWIEREIPIHMPKRIPIRTCIWASQSKMKKADWDDYESLLDPEFEGLRIMAVNFEQFSAAPGRWDRRNTKNPAKPFLGYVLKTMMDSMPTMFVADESSKIKTPGVRRSQRIVNMGDRAKYRRILTGTLGGPLEAYNQFLFLSPEILGYKNYLAYKHRYAEWKRVTLKAKGPNGRRQEYDELVGYKHLDELQRNIDSHSSRVLKRDCLDLPEKIYMRRTVLLGPDQAKRYQLLLKQSILDLRRKEGGDVVQVQNVLTKYLRLQQVLGGWLPPTEEDVFNDPDARPTCMYDDPKSVPRIKALLDVIEENREQQVIIWARFRHEIEAITDILNALYGDEENAHPAQSFYGGTPKDKRSEIIDGFQAGKYQFFVGQQHSGGYGITLTAANVMIYYSNDFSLEARLQSEDRCHRIGQKANVLYVDLETPKSLDTRILEALLNKKEIADTVVGDDPSAWF